MIDVACAVILRDAKIMVTQRSDSMSLPLKWEFPGGKIENGESAEACVLREIKEELNIDIAIIRKMDSVIHDYGTFQIQLIPFLAKFISGEIILLEHKEYRFVEVARLLELDWADADLPIVDEILNKK